MGTAACETASRGDEFDVANKCGQKDALCLKGKRALRNYIPAKLAAALGLLAVMGRAEEQNEAKRFGEEKSRL